MPETKILDPCFVMSVLQDLNRPTLISVPSFLGQTTVENVNHGLYSLLLTQRTAQVTALVKPELGIHLSTSSLDIGRKPGMHWEESLDEESVAWKWLQKNFPKVTLSALTETGQTESTILVPMQRSYTGIKPIIRSALANTPCADLGVNGVLKELNATLLTSYTLHNPTLSSILESFIRQDYDFGTLYANLRPYWYDLNHFTSVKRIHRSWNKDREMRQNIVTNDRISNGNIVPRRVWDLFANRVVPFWVARKCWWVISHAWMSDKDRIDVWTPINGYEWPVPIPKDADLNLIWIEMLNMGAEYVWLDVLCLRQAGGQREDLRREEWKVDVPTIGAIYRNGNRKVVYYLSGLGRPFCLKPGDLESDQCWFRRAWTLQEVSHNFIIGGDMSNGSIFYILSQMRNHVSTKPLDKVAGLAYLLRRKSIPIYNESQSEEDAWVALTEVMCERYRMELLFLYPEPGNGRRCWQPSWNQVMAMVIVPETRIRLWKAELRTDETGVDSYEGACIKSGHLQGLGDASYNGIPRQGELVVKDRIGVPRILKIVTDHTYLIPDGLYTFISDSYHSRDYYEPSLHWVVGQQRQDGKFEKVLVIKLPDLDKDWKLCPLGDAQVHAKMVLC
ncbi:uncharacterized protein EV420DRAFT_1669813 [Desarmillaria tabescens]|uniref:Heterokaryon incompatibility domain-containing protein n=1 Tax=Armillaria tabescens TaxID=1929756 RepID=A0AA39MKP1_ARMTA|nr:uncharacterized protein EV420DRAFT_1669813 [Desarmillaria tabescens]KAK0437433.1 hypothetical protein EV420DRAFT_1669813 [Desarmillaria tabescens]